MPAGLLRPAVLWTVLVAFGLSYGLNFGTSNHTFYLLPTERMLHPELWKNDWAVTQTHHYHVVFAHLAAGILSLDPSGWLMAIANVLTIAAGMACMGALLRVLFPTEQAGLGLLFLILIASATRTHGPGGSYVLSDIFQPNTLGSVGMLAASWLTVTGRPLASGLTLLAMGTVHANYLVLSLPVFGIAQLLQGREGLSRRLAVQLAPPLLIVLIQLPIMLETSRSPIVAEAQRIYQDIRSPHHYRVEGFASLFLPWLGWQLLGLGSIWDKLRDSERPGFRRLLGVLLGYWMLIVPSVALAAAFVIRPLIQLYPWRLTVNCELLAQAAFAGAAVSSLSPALGWPKPRGAARVALAVGLACLTGAALHTGRPVPALFAWLGCAALFWSELILALPGVRRRAVQLLAAVLLVGLVIANTKRFVTLADRSNLLREKEPGLEELCRWAQKETGVDAILLTPPDDERVRFWCRRAIVIDWKTAPMVPGEVMAWYRRIEDVAGRRVTGAADLAGYAELDREAVRRLKAKYHFDYVIAYRGSEPKLGLTPIFRGSRFVAYRADL
jgi:hypothetical protein